MYEKGSENYGMASTRQNALQNTEQRVAPYNIGLSIRKQRYKQPALATEFFVVSKCSVSRLEHLVTQHVYFCLILWPQDMCTVHQRERAYILSSCYVKE